MNNADYNLHKVGGILIFNKKLLVCRAKTKNFFIAPGGKVRKGESLIRALQRELKEELAVVVSGSALEKFGTFYALAAGDEKNIVRVDVFIVKNWRGQPQPNSEVEEIAWVSSNSPKTMKIGSIFEREVIPRLKELEMIN